MKQLAFLIVLALSLNAEATETSLRECIAKSGGITDEGLCHDAEIRKLWITNRQLSNQIINELQTCTPHEVGFDYSSALQDFKKSSINWSGYMRRDCNITGAIFGQGTAYFLEVDDCQIDHLRKRNKRLRQLVKNLISNKRILKDLNREQQTDGGITCKEPEK